MVESIAHVLDNATRRDESADHRDEVAIERDHFASLAAFTAQAGPYLHDMKARRDAAINRFQSKDDRTAAADDRIAMTPSIDPAEDHESP